MNSETSDLICPKCDDKLETQSFCDIEFKRCAGCQGLWFDVLEKDHLVAIEGSESIDLGSSEVGSQYSEQRDIACPKCNVDMIAMIDKDQFHIRYESCPTCYGTFFDAGEFRDLKEHTVLERFTQMLQTLSRNLQ